MQTYPPTATIAAAFVASIVDFGTRRGLDRDALLRHAGLTPADFETPEARVESEASCRLWEHIADALGDPAIAVAFATETRLEDLTVLGFALMTSASGRECLTRAVRFIDLVTDAGRWAVDETPHEVAIRWVRGVAPWESHIANECALTKCLHSYRQCIGHEIVPLRVTFQHAAPADTSPYLRFFGCEVKFGARDDAMVLPASVLDLVPRGANPALSAFFEGHALSLLSSQQTEAGTADRAREAVARELTSGEPSMPSVARRLGLSERSLRRVLTDEGTSFRRLVEGVRRERAEQLLRDERRSIAEIAFLLGFANVSAFGRAFKRWLGVSPGEFRTGGTATSLHAMAG